MKALILAAGLGTRLLPYTQKIPKPLFSLLSKPVLAHAILQLKNAGCTQIIINTHHLHRQIETFVEQNDFGIDIRLLHEPDILETGGAIANAREFLKNSPFFVVNADVFSTIDLNLLNKMHQKSGCSASLVLHDDIRFNKVGIDDKGFITNFNSEINGLAFTGIQVLSPEIYEHLPLKKKFSSIEVYKSLCSKKQVQGVVHKNIFWSDIGTVDDYQKTSILLLCAKSFGIEYNNINTIDIEPLSGDGSDRIWFRARYKNETRVISDHGICLPGSENFLQINAFIKIGDHLLKKGLNVPRILDYDTLSGMVILEDLGDIHLEALIKKPVKKTGKVSGKAPNFNNKTDDDGIRKLYENAIDHLIEFCIAGADGFDKKWTCQTETYSKELILDKECRYFMDAFVRDYLNLDQTFDAFSDEFEEIADQALAHGFNGLMHRDMQSRNIMAKENQLFFIDFQSARIGPMQYDLASLLIDPYVKLNRELKADLLQYAMEKLKLGPVQCKMFVHSFNFCCLTRNLQFLGAFSFLTLKKNKPYFKQYIPEAVNSLADIIQTLDNPGLPKLQKLVQTITGAIKNGKN